MTDREHRQARIRAYESGADEALHLAREAMQRARNDLTNGNIRDPGKLATNLAVASGVFTDKARLLNGEPTEITEHRDPKLAAQQLARRLGIVIDSTAEDITPSMTIVPHAPEGGPTA